MQFLCYLVVDLLATICSIDNSSKVWCSHVDSKMTKELCPHFCNTNEYPSQAHKHTRVDYHKTPTKCINVPTLSLRSVSDSVLDKCSYEMHLSTNKPYQFPKSNATYIPILSESFDYLPICSVCRAKAP